MKNITVILLIFLAVTISNAQNSISGKVVNELKNPLSEVSILIEGTTKGTLTDDSGFFKLENIKNGNYKLIISMMGYRDKRVSVNVSNQNKTIPTIKLTQQNNQLNEVLVEGEKDKTKIPSTSLRLKTAVQKIPQNIQVVSDAVLENQLITNMLEGPFRNVSGVSNIEHWGHFAKVNMRGFRLPAFRNGVNIQDSWGPLSEDMFMVDKIEFVKGPSGFMMSAGEPGGFYNVVTKKPTNKRIAKVSLMVGTQDTYRGAVDFGGKIGKDERFLYRVNTMYQSKGTHREHQKPGTRFGFAPALSYQITPKTKFLTELSYQKVKDYIGSAYVFNTPDKGYASLGRNFSMIDETFPQTDIQEVSLLNRLTHNFNKNWSVEAQYVMMDYNQEGYSFWYFIDDTKNPPESSLKKNGDIVRVVSLWDAISEGDYFQIYANGKFKTGGVNHKVMAGFDFTEKKYWAYFYAQKKIDVNTPFNVYNPEYTAPTPTFDRNYKLKDSDPYYGSIIRSFYAQDEVSFLQDKIRLTLAGRYTQLDPMGAFGREQTEKFTPRVGLSADISPQLTFYGLYDQSFLPNNINPADVEKGVKLSPVEGTIYEWGLKSKFLNNRLRASLSIYNITKNNLPLTSGKINSKTGKPFVYPDSEVTSEGYEVDIQGKITDEFSIILNYAKTNVEDSKGNRIAGHAKHITNSWLTYNFSKSSKLKGFGLSLGYQYQIDRSTWTWAGTNQKTDLPDYFRLDGTVTWKNDKWQVGLNINNILDRYLYSGANYRDSLYWQSEPGTNGRISISYKL